MCTVSYIPFRNGGFVLTHNRDESVNRPAALPQYYEEYHTRLYYPKDLKKGGTWIGVSQKKRLICLLNGAFKKHQRLTVYPKSRGILVKEFLATEKVAELMSRYLFRDIEPFFSLILEWKEALTIKEMIWDGNQIYLHNKKTDQPCLWTSSMTYSADDHMIKDHLFKKFLGDYHPVSGNLIWEFHHKKEDTGASGFVIDRGILKTTSISQFTLRADGKEFFHYEDLITGNEKEQKIF